MCDKIYIFWKLAIRFIRKIKKNLNILKNASCEIIYVANDLIDIINFENSEMHFNMNKNNPKNILMATMDEFKDDLKNKKLTMADKLNILNYILTQVT